MVGEPVYTFFLAKEASGAAFCGLPPSTLGLRHRLRPTAWDTAVAPGGRRSFIAASHPSNWPFGGGILSAVLPRLDLQRMGYGFGYGSPWSLAGLVHVSGGGHLPCCRFRRCTAALGVAAALIVHTIRRGDQGVVFAIKWPARE
jgi:hypothetical protein